MHPLKSILVVDDHQIVFLGIQLIFQTSNMSYDLVECKNGDECIHHLRKKKFDLIILDINLPGTDAFQLVTLMKNLYPGQKILVFSMNSEELYAKRFFQLGVNGFINKQASNEEFKKAVLTILKGEKYISERLIRLFAEDALNGDQNNHLFEKLTPREFEIMTYFLQGNTSKEVSNITNLHASTIGTYKFRIFEKLKVKNMLELHDLNLRIERSYVQ